MELITHKRQAAFAATRLPDDVRQRVESLGPDASPDEIDATIYGPYWTSRPVCDECNEYQEEVVEVGDLGETALCRSCLEKALAMFGEVDAHA